MHDSADSMTVDHSDESDVANPFYSLPPGEEGMLLSNAGANLDVFEGLLQGVGSKR